MQDFAITRTPRPEQMARFREGTPPRFLLTVDTEEDFDWSQPFRRDGWRLDSLSRLGAFQRFCEDHGARPAWLVDYPVATSPLAVEALGDALAAGRAEIGLQLHPWVNPPYDETLSPANSFAGNLPFELERAKLLALHEAVTGNFGHAPTLYRAGRYGAGENTARILKDIGIAVDTSVRARFDYADFEGPDYARMDSHPWWVDEPGSLLELPLTTLFTGRLGRRGAALHPVLKGAPWLLAALARLALMERIPLTPEGVTVAEARRAIDAALTEGVKVLVFSFHSPSLLPGCTPYVRDEEGVKRLYAWWREIFACLAAQGIGCASTRDIIGSLALAPAAGAG